MSLVDLFSILKWWGLFFLLGVTFLPITFKIFSSFRDKGYIFSKFLGLVLVSYAIFILSSLHILKFNLPNIILVWILLSVLTIFILRKEKFEFKNSLKIIILEEFIFLVSLLAWSYIRGFNPDIHGLEKFMDFGFINSIMRSDYFPPRDMWFTPHSINYYYFGHLYTAVATKLTNIPSFITFNLMIATIFAFTFTLSFSIGLSLIEKIKHFPLKKLVLIGGVFGYASSLSGNLHTIYAFFKPYDTNSPAPFWDLLLSISTFPNSYWYPNATRFIYNTIHEFPSYSFVVSDLHGHVLSIPIILTIIALLLIVFINKSNNNLFTIIISFLIATSYMTNAWDGLIYIGLTLLVIFFVSFIYQKTPAPLIKTWRADFKMSFTNAFIDLFKHGALLALMFFTFTFVFNQNFSPFAVGIGINCAPAIFVEIGKIGPFLFEKGQCQTTPVWQFLILWGFFIFMVSSFLIFLRKRSVLISDYFVIILSLFSLFLLFIPEFIYLKDIYTGHFRANTMFKLGYQAFIMLSISSIYILFRIISNARFRLPNIRGGTFQLLGFVLFTLISFLFLFLVSSYPYFAVPSGYKDLEINKGLNGIKYLQISRLEDYHAIGWINKNIKNQPVILEAQGDSYTDFARISANTGLPTVLGWTVHEWLWRGSYDIPASRFDDITNIYETSDPGVAKKIIEKYNISYVYVGGLEKEKYNIYEDKFLELGEIVYKNGDTKIYKLY